MGKEKSPFKLKSDLKPAGDQPKAIKKLLNNLQRGVKEQILLGATGTGKSLHPEERVWVGEKKGKKVKWKLLPIGEFVEGLKGRFPMLKLSGDFIIPLPKGKFWTLSLNPESFEVEEKPLYAVSFHPEREKIFEITLEDGRRIRTSGDHNFYALTPEGFVLKKTIELTKSDFVPLPRFAFPAEGYLEAVNPYQFLKNPAEGGSFNLRLKFLPEKIALDREFLEFIGLFIAEGTTSGRYTVISTTSDYYKGLVREVANRLGLKVYDRNGRDLTIYGKTFAEFLKALCGARSGEKRLPPFWVNLSKKQLGWLLRAIFDGDGGVDKTAVSLTTKSKPLAEDLLYALLSLGVHARVSETFRRATNSNHRGGIYYRLNIYGGEVERFLNAVGFNDGEKLKRAKVLANKRRNTNLDTIPHLGKVLREIRLQKGLSQRAVAKEICRQAVSAVEVGKRSPSVQTFGEIVSNLNAEGLKKFSKLRWVRVREVKEIPYAGFVYDLSVEDNETFLAGFGGLFVHNTFTLANVIAKWGKPTLVMVHNKILAAQLYREFKELFPDNAVEYFVSYYDYYRPEAYIPERDLYIEKDASINEILEKYRHSATRSVLERRDTIVVASVSAIYGLGAPENYIKLRLQLHKGMVISHRQLFKRLVEMGYKRNDYAIQRATFSVKGDAVEIVPSHTDEELIRIEFWDDEIDRIQRIGILNREVIEDDIEHTVIYPATHYLAPRPTVEEALRQIEKDLIERVAWFKKQGREVEAQRLFQRTSHDIEMIKETGTCKGIENYSRYFEERKPGEPPFTLLDYFPDDFLLIIDESHQTISQIRAMYEGDRSRKLKLVEYGWRLPSALDNRPLKFDEFLQKLNTVIYVSATPGDWELKRVCGKKVD